jgi:LexA-binding, inner membrane-associated putative hydrolase
MLVGHYAVAFTGKSVETKLSLGTLVLAAMLPDILWTLFTISGIEYSASKLAQGNFDVAMSHSLLTIIIWGALFAGAYYSMKRDSRGAWILFVAVLSHWILDVISHKHSIAPGINLMVGLGLWKSLPLTLLVEGGFWVISIILYIRATYAAKPMGTWGFWPVVVFLTFVWATNVHSGPPPPERIVGSLIFFLLLVVWAYWINTLRPPRSEKE